MQGDILFHSATLEQCTDDKNFNSELEVWKCERLKLTSQAKEILFPNPCVWASSGENVAPKSSKSSSSEKKDKSKVKEDDNEHEVSVASPFEMQIDQF